MAIPFNDLLKQARLESLYPHPKDFAEAIMSSFGGYLKWETGERIPSRSALDTMLKQNLLPKHMEEDIEEAWRAAKAMQAGIPAPVGSVDVPRMVSQLERELVVVLRKYASDSSTEHRRIVKTFMTRAKIILSTALET